MFNARIAKMDKGRKEELVFIVKNKQRIKDVYRKERKEELEFIAMFCL